MSLMPVQRIRPLVSLACLLGLTGCINLPSPKPARVYTPPGSAADDTDGLIFRNRSVPKTSSAPPAEASGVVTASATESSGEGLNRVPSPDSPVAGRQPQPPQPATSPPPTAVPIPGAGAVLANPDAKKKDGFDLADLAPDAVYKNVKTALGYGPDEKIARTTFQEGRDLFQQKKYEEAAAKFHTASWRWPDSTLEEDALFMLGESWFFSDRYSKAKDSYDNLLKKHQNTRHLDTVVKRQFAIGRYWEQLHMSTPRWPVTPNVADKSQPLFDTFGNAISAYETVRLYDPIGPLADDSVMASANAYFRKGRYEDAAHDYDLLRKEYPKSEHQMEAHLLGLQCKQLVYHGPFYEGKPLNDAEDIAKQTLSQFGSKLGPEKDRVMQTANRIREQKAQRQWAMAQYYDNKKYFGAARHYYQAILKDFPLTQTARMAQSRLEEIKGEPDVPPNRFKWLTSLFPERDN